MDPKRREAGREFVNQLLVELAERQGTDLYLVTGAKPTMRVVRELVSIGTVLTPAQTHWLVESLMDEHAAKEYREYGEVNFAISLPGVARFRVNAYKQRGSAGMVVRLIPSEIPAFETLSLPGDLPELMLAERGLLLVVGATGQGKSTTMASMIDYRNANRHGHIVMIEDPVEFTHRHRRSLVSQREVGTDTISFQSAMRAALRQSPDVIVVGEIRDQASMRLALEAADTGHLCVGSLHATNAPHAMDRVINFFPESERRQVLMDLSVSLNAVISQRLIPLKDGGRRPVIELLRNTATMANLIRQGRTQDLRQQLNKSLEQGMLTFDQCLFDLFEEHVIDAKTALSYSDSPNDLRLKIRLSGGTEEGEDESAPETSVIPNKAAPLKSGDKKRAADGSYKIVIR